MMAVQGSVPGAPAARRAFIGLGVLVFLLPLGIIAGYVLPAPGALVAPAALEPVEGLITVGKATAEPAGHLYLATLRLNAEPCLGQYLLASLQSDVEVVPKSRVRPASLDAGEFQRLSQRLLSESLRIAEVVALRKAGARVSVEEAEVQVLATVPGTPADANLRPGDLIESVDGETIRAAAELVSIVHGRLSGEPVSLRIRRDGRVRTVTLPAMHGPLDAEGPVLGAVVASSGLQYKAPLAIEVDSGPLSGGPAAGLMYALGIYNALVTEDITRGYRIAGTGTLRLNGKVGSVDGIALKVRAAEEAGIDYFLAPTDNAPAARAAARDMEIIPVGSFDEALNALRQIDGPSEPGLQVVPARGDTTLAYNRDGRMRGTVAP
jgi:PDZ domain-containing protein